MNYTTIYEKVFQAFPVLVYSFSLFLYVISGKILPIYFAGGIYLFVTLPLPYYKKFFEIYMNIHIFKRPNPPKTGCGYFDDITFPGAKSFGFPSGHSMFSGFFCIFWTLFILESHQRDFENLRLIILWYISLTVCVSRIYNGCHNFIQVLFGFLYGFGTGLLWFNILKESLI